MVDGDGLFAVLDEAQYPLRPSGVDRFTTITGQTVRFPRDTSGKVTGYEQDGKFHLRVSTMVTPEAAALAHPRPKGQDSPADYRHHPPADLHDGIAVGDIAGSDLKAATAEAIVRGILDGTYKDVHSVLLYQRGKLVMEEYFYGYRVQRQHQLRSATKSVVSTLAGIAIDQGALSGVDERVLPQMSYTSYANPDPRKAAMTLYHFLSMSTGLDCNDHSATSPGRETVIDDAPDWVKATLDLPMINNPGTQAYYCSGGVSVVGRLIENAVHMRLPDFAQKYLFEPLGISRADWVWNYDLTSADKEYSQIHLRSRDMLKLGVVFADNGSWHGRQVIPASWAHAVRNQPLQLRNLATELTLLTVLRRSLAVVYRLQTITPLVDQPLMYAELSGQSQNVLAALQPLHRHLPECIGLPPHSCLCHSQFLSRIFDKFYRVAELGSSNDLGLGLAICKAFVEAHGRRISFENDPMGGTIVRFVIPFH
jgi:CubicO group peptidase (beta-lactamase class C family)